MVRINGGVIDPKTGAGHEQKKEDRLGQYIHNTCRQDTKEIEPKTTQDEEKQDRNGQNKRGGHRSERPEPDMNKKRRAGLVIEKNTIHVDRTQNRRTEIRRENNTR